MEDSPGEDRDSKCAVPYREVPRGDRAPSLDDGDGSNGFERGGDDNRLRRGHDEFAHARQPR